MEAGGETVAQVFSILAHLRAHMHDETRTMVDDILMMLDYDQAMMLDESSEGESAF